MYRWTVSLQSGTSSSPSSSKLWGISKVSYTRHIVLLQCSSKYVRADRLQVTELTCPPLPPQWGPPPQTAGQKSPGKKTYIFFLNINYFDKGFVFLETTKECCCCFFEHTAQSTMWSRRKTKSNCQGLKFPVQIYSIYSNFPCQNMFTYDVGSKQP